MSIKLLNAEKPFVQPLLQAELQHVLVVQSETPGDLVMLSPALRALRRSLPEAKITLMTSPAGCEVAPLVPWIDDVLVDQDSWSIRYVVLDCSTLVRMWPSSRSCAGRTSRWP